MDRIQEQVKTIVFHAVDEINQDLKDNAKLNKSLDTILFGQGAKIDSMALVSLIVAVEEGISDEFGVAVTLANEKALSMAHSPFKSLGSMIDYVFDIVSETDGE